MRRPAIRHLALCSAGAALLAAAAPGKELPWPVYGGDPQHTGRIRGFSQAPQQIHWQAPVDLDPQYSGDDLLIHYGSPLATAGNTIVFPVKTGAAGGFRAEARLGASGILLWSLDTDYVLPDHDWVPSCGVCLTPRNEVAIPGAGGTVILRSDADEAEGEVRRIAFYGTEEYEADPSAFDTAIRICTPITSDRKGNLYFGFLASGGAPLGLESGIARISRNGRGRWIAAADAAEDPGIVKVVTNCAPALDRRGGRLYLAVSDLEGPGFGTGWLLGLTARTLAPKQRVRLDDPTGGDALLPDAGTASPTVGPDGDVFFGIWSPSNHSRGFLLHFDRRLRPAGVPGGFGWDDTASIVPAWAVDSYEGDSRYLVLTKYNDYAGAGGDGVNRLAVLDPGDSIVDPISGADVMAEVLTVAGPTPDDDFVDSGFPDAVREWCINTAAVDASARCALVNNEDGILYRWDFTTNTLTEQVTLTAGVGEAYTPTIVAPDGRVYAINNAILFATGVGP